MVLERTVASVRPKFTYFLKTLLVRYTDKLFQPVTNEKKPFRKGHVLARSAPAFRARIEKERERLSLNPLKS